MTINDKIKNEKVIYDINREAAKISALSSVQTDKLGEEILLSHQSRIIKSAKFTYFFFGKAFERQIKTIKEQGKKTWIFRSFKTYYPNINN